MGLRQQRGEAGDGCRGGAEESQRAVRAHIGAQARRSVGHCDREAVWREPRHQPVVFCICPTVVQHLLHITETPLCCLQEEGGHWPHRPTKTIKTHHVTYMTEDLALLSLSIFGK